MIKEFIYYSQEMIKMNEYLIRYWNLFAMTKFKYKCDNRMKFLENLGNANGNRDAVEEIWRYMYCENPIVKPGWSYWVNAEDTKVL